MYKHLGLEQGYSPLVESREHLMKYEPKSYEELPDRSMQDSFTSAIIPLSKDRILQDKYVTFLGSVRHGRLMEDMDLFAVWVVHQHLNMPNHPADVPLPYTFVTILVDKIDFTNYIPKYNGDIRLSGHVSFVGKTSVEVVVWLEQFDNGLWHKLTRALFLMASRNSTNTKAAIINRLVPKDDNEKRILDGGEMRKKRRIKTQQESLLKVEPNDFEQKLIHDLFISTVELNDFTFKKRKLPPGGLWMADTNISNIILSYPEDRNAHNAIFGGFLMRHALELSFVTAYNCCKKRPTLVRISDITFHRPVHVSSCIKMHSKVIYSEMNYLQLVVIAEVTDPGSDQQHISNVFYYTYKLQEDIVPTVLPKTYTQAMWYLDGRRKFKYAMSELSLK